MWRLLLEPQGLTNVVAATSESGLCVLEQKDPVGAFIEGDHHPHCPVGRMDDEVIVEEGTAEVDVLADDFGA